jgi:uncharacterized protein
LTHFADAEHGGFFFTADDHEALIYRPKIFTDDVIPSGNSIACLGLQRLGWLLGESRYLAFAEKTLMLAWPDIVKYPAAHASMFIALQEYLTPPEIIILRGTMSEMQPWKKALQEKFKPGRLVIAIDKDAVDLPPILAEKQPQESVIAYVCRGVECLTPIMNLSELQRGLLQQLPTSRSQI